MNAHTNNNTNPSIGNPWDEPWTIVDNDVRYFRLRLVSIDAWRDADGMWFWNDSVTLRRNIRIRESHTTTRRVLNMLRREGFLSSRSRGRVTVDHHYEQDPICVEVLDKYTREPLLALIPDYV
jgi:hypothetical protein